MNAVQRFTSLAVGIFFASCLSSANAGVMLNSLGGNNWEIQFSPITLTATGGELNWLIFEDFFSGPAVANGSVLNSPQSISIDVGGAGAQSFLINNNLGTFTNPVGGLDPNDLYINIAQANPVATATAGQSVVVTDNGGVQFTIAGLPAENANWNGQVAFWDNVSDQPGVKTTDDAFVGVPSPATLGLLGLGLVGLGYSRRKKA